MIPSHLFHEVDEILVGDFEELNDREVQAIYKDGAIYVTNAQSDNTDMVDDIIHELSHSLEHQYGMYLYADQKLHDEFIEKRKRLYHNLRSHEFEVSAEDFLEHEFNKEFDSLLYKDIGYGLLSNLTLGLFINPYAITSLKEYYATGFEEYFLGDRNYLRDMSPQLYLKLKEIIENGKDLY